MKPRMVCRLSYDGIELLGQFSLMKPEFALKKGESQVDKAFMLESSWLSYDENPLQKIGFSSMVYTSKGVPALAIPELVFNPLALGVSVNSYELSKNAKTLARLCKKVAEEERTLSETNVAAVILTIAKVTKCQEIWIEHNQAVVERSRFRVDDVEAYPRIDRLAQGICILSKAA